MDILNEISVIFSVKNAPEDAYVVGSSEILGSWNPLYAIKLFKVENVSSTLTSIKLIKHTNIEYKYITKANNKVTWESIANRKLTPHNNLYIEDIFNSPISHLDYSQKRFERLRRNSSELKLKRPLKENHSVIIASMALPFRLEKVDQQWEVYENNSSWHYQLYSVACEKFEFSWIGYPGVNVPIEEQADVLRLLEKYKCVPVFVPEDTLKFHAAYCDNILFNVLNNVIDLTSPVFSEKNTQQWEGFKILNILFNETLFAVYTGQMVWIHGTELLLLPSFLTRKVKEPVNIGFSFHKPFPSSEVFRILPHKITILNALCCCDVIGFQIFDHARHFLGACKRILGIQSNTSKSGEICLNYFGRNITICVGHIGITPETIQKVQAKTEYKEYLAELKRDYKDRKVILSINHSVHFSGLTLKLSSIRNFLQNKNILHKNLLFLQILLPNDDFKDIEKRAEKQSNDINTQFNREVVRLIVRDITELERYAYMAIASGMIVCTIREGLCLWPFEYLFIKQYHDSGIVLSEFVGSSRMLSSPFKVNPFDTNALENGIMHLVKYEPNKKFLDRDLAYITTRTAEFWTLDFLCQVSNSIKNTAKYQYVSIGMNDTLRVMAIPKTFNKLDDLHVLAGYKTSKNRVFLFDIEGAMLSLVKDNDIFMPSPRILAALDDLCCDMKNTVMIITGKERSVLCEWFDSVQGLNMAAEYGAFIKFNSSDWETYANPQSKWKESSKKIIEAHVQRTEGSCMIEKESSVMFNYKDADSGFGQWQAKDLMLCLENSLNSDECEVVEEEGFVEVRPKGIDKVSTLCKVLHKIMKIKGKIDFLFSIGDDASDEKMFKMVKMLKKRGCDWFSNEVKCYTCTFGLKPSEAMYYFLNPDDVIRLMELLSASSKQRAHSLGNLVTKHSNHYSASVNANAFARSRNNTEFLDITDLSDLMTPN